MKHVIVLGGGVAGMSAAHELVARQFKVTVYEQGTVEGGKARSFGVPNTAVGNRENLPAEHGFRFFPGFYRHLPDTMKRIPYGGNPDGVFDNLVDATQMQIFFNGRSQLVVPSRFPRSLDDVTAVLSASGYLTTAVGLTPKEIELYTERVWRLLTSCEERRADELERLNWWEYIDADAQSDIYKAYLGRTPRVLVAADPEKANTKTVGDVLLQLLFNLMDPGMSADRVLNGPTNKVWLTPWLRHLRNKGVHYEFGAKAIELRVSKGRIAGVRIRREDGSVREETADYYVAALPVEKMASLVTRDLLRRDPSLEGIVTLAGHVDWMAGIQFYLLNEQATVYGHQMYLGSPWALTSISQAQFWGGPADFARRYGDGTVRTALSVDVSDWLKTKGTNNKLAKDCTRKEVADEVLKQLRDAGTDLQPGDLHPKNPWELDPSIEEIANPGTGPKLRNHEPLLVNEPNTWKLRPWARTAIPNLFLAADYVRTYTNLATMEAANEAARRAVNAIIDASGSKAAPCELWALHEPLWVKPWRLWDLVRYRRGEAWDAELPDFVQRAAEAILEGAPSIGESTQYADAAVRDMAAEGIGVVPDYVQQQVTDTVLSMADALERGDIGVLGTLFAPGAKIESNMEVGGQTTVGAKTIGVDVLLPLLDDILAAGWDFTVDVKSVNDIRPSGRLVVGRYTAAIGFSAADPPKSGSLTVSFTRTGAPDKVAAGDSRWWIQAINFTALG